MALFTKLLGDLDKTTMACESFHHQHESSGFFDSSKGRIGAQSLSAIKESIYELVHLKRMFELVGKRWSSVVHIVSVHIP